MLTEYEKLRRQMKALLLGYKAKYPECAPLFTQYSFRPHPVQKPRLISLCEQSFYKGYEMAISFSKGVREFEWSFEKAWQTLQNLHSTAHKHLDPVEDMKEVNANIRGYCFANGLEKSFNLNYEIILKNGLPTHLYDARNEEVDELKGVLYAVNMLRMKMGMVKVKSQAIEEFQELKKKENKLLQSQRASDPEANMMKSINQMKQQVKQAQPAIAPPDVFESMGLGNIDDQINVSIDSPISQPEPAPAPGITQEPSTFNVNGQINVDSLLEDDGMGESEFVPEPTPVEIPEVEPSPDESMIEETGEDNVINTEGMNQEAEDLGIEQPVVEEEPSDILSIDDTEREDLLS